MRSYKYLLKDSKRTLYFHLYNIISQTRDLIGQIPIVCQSIDHRSDVQNVKTIIYTKS